MGHWVQGTLELSVLSLQPFHKSKTILKIYLKNRTILADEKHEVCMYKVDGS